MKKGEKARFTIRSEYGYGQNGSPPKIPADATLIFEVELLSWIDEVKLTKDGGVVKKILHPIEDVWETPKEDSEAVINYSLSLENNTFIEEQKEFRFIIGADQVPEGLDKAVASMKKGEKALVKVLPQYGYGETGNEEKKIPAHATLIYEVEMVDYTKVKATWEMSAEEKLDACRKAKDEGNELYKTGNYAKAAKKYKKAGKFVDTDYSFKEEEKEAAKLLKVACHLNSAACDLKLKQYKDVLENSKKVLDIDKDNVKALFRRGQAHSELDNWDEAQQDFRRAQELDPNNKEITRELQRLKRKMIEQDKKDKQRFKKIFAKLSEETEKEDKAKVEKVSEDQLEIEKTGNQTEKKEEELEVKDE